MIGGAVKGFEFPPSLVEAVSASGGREGQLMLGIRPEGVLVSSVAQPGFIEVEAHIIEPLGSHDIVDLRIGDEMLRARTRSGDVKRAGDKVFARIDPAQAHFFDMATGRNLGVVL